MFNLLEHGFRRKNTNFTQACLNFIHDLRTFTEIKDSRSRLDQTGHEFYLRRLYVDQQTGEMIMALKIINVPVSQELAAVAQKRIEQKSHQ